MLFFCRLLVMVAVVVLISCTPDFVPAQPPPVDFRTRELLSLPALGKDTVLWGNTVLTENQVIFEAIGDYDKYEWTIGNDANKFNAKRVRLRFEEPIDKLLIKLSVRNIGSDGQENQYTTYRYLTIIDFWKNPIFGVFEGVNKSEPKDPFDVEVSHDEWFDFVHVMNINRGCNPIVSSISQAGFNTSVAYKTIFFSSGFYYQGCSDPSGWLTIDATNKKVNVDYSVGTGSNDQLTSPRVKYQIFWNAKRVTMRNINIIFQLLLCSVITVTGAFGQTGSGVGQMRGILTVPGSNAHNPERSSKTNTNIFDWTAEE